MVELTGGPAELRMTIEVKRAATGQVEVFEMVGTVVPEEEHGNDAQHSSPERGD